LFLLFLKKRMNALNTILHNWYACDPDGVLLPATRLGKIFDLIAQQLDVPSLPASVRADAAGLLKVTGSGLPPVLRILHISGRMVHDEIIHFFRFWQAFEELARRLQVGHGEYEPIADEIAEYRDEFLRRVELDGATQAMDGFVTQASLNNDLARIRAMSADSASWAMLETDLCVGRRNPKKHLQLHVVFESLLSWLHRVCLDYTCGPRAAKIRCVRDVTGCGQREACMCLSSAYWDTENALRVFFARQLHLGSSALTETSWCTQGAKLQKNDVECPICMHPYMGHEDAVGEPIQFRCCFQVLCRSCYIRLANDQSMVICPFCREIDHVQACASREGGARRRSRSLGKICRNVERVATGAYHMLGTSLRPIL
jgi:hypothetical protein